MTPVFFTTQSDFRSWFIKNHKKETELIVGFYKVATGKACMTWSQSVDEALCFGWIDAVRKSIDAESYQIRFTQRKASSIWSAVNVKKIEELTKQGLMYPAGIASFEKRQAHKSSIYSYEIGGIDLSVDFEKKIKANKKAWTYFENLAPSYRKTSINWVMAAKQEATQTKRLETLIRDSEAGINQWKDSKYKK